MSAKRDVLDDFRMLEAEREKLLPPLVCWPQLLIWIARRDGVLARDFDADADNPRHEYALCQILRATLARGGAESVLDRNYDLDADREVMAAEEDVYKKLRAEVGPLTALAKSTSSRPLEQDTLYSVQRNVWNSAKIRAHESVGTFAQRGATYTAIRFRREDVLRLWPPTPFMRSRLTDAPAQPATVAGERACQKWFEDMMANNSTPDNSADAYVSLAQKKFAVSARGVGRARAAAIVATGNAAWSRAGRKSPQQSPQ